MVGRAQVAFCTARGDEVYAYDHSTLDISNARQVNEAFAREKPEVVFNCAAWTDVDGCESDLERAQAANALGPEVLAHSCRKVGALLVTISTDYVFDGLEEGFYTQRNQPNPQSVYARTKLDGERRAQQAWARTIVARTGYVFGIGGNNFLSTLIPRAQRGERLSAISDMFGTPTYAEDLAKRLYELARLDLPAIFHVTNGGPGVSFAEFAQAALDEAHLDTALVTPVSLDSLKRPAPRPRNSRLRCVLSPAVGLDPLRDWEEALRALVKGLRLDATSAS
jgi:dTDP-4-dehydrorhamnose reductase